KPRTNNHPRRGRGLMLAPPPLHLPARNHPAAPDFKKFGPDIRPSLSRKQKLARRPYVFKPSGAMGSDRRRPPVAFKIALPTAGASPTSGVSPAPAEGKSLRSTRTTSMTGTSLNLGTRYLDN